MTAVVKKLREKRGGFEVPTVEDIHQHMREKKGWPDEFCKWYAEKFWNNYEAAGWKLSNGNSMKSWTAAFAANWQDLKYEETREKLKQCLKTVPAVIKPIENMTERLNSLMEQYRQNFQSVPDDKLVRIYDYLKLNKMIRLSDDEKRYIKQAYGDNVEKGKAACVKTMFTNMINHGQRF